MTVQSTTAPPREQHLELVSELRDRLRARALGGPEASRARHVARGKLLPRDRVERLLDPGSPFLELAPLAAEGMYDDERRRPPASSPASAGSAAGECVVVANDATVKGGTYYPMTVKKHLRAQEIALAEPAALHLPGRLRRRLPAPRRTRSSPTATTSAGSSSTRPR